MLPTTTFNNKINLNTAKLKNNYLRYSISLNLFFPNKNITTSYAIQVWHA